MNKFVLQIAIIIFFLALFSMALKLALNFLAAFFRKKIIKPAGYKEKKYLLTPAEKDFYAVLRSVVENDYYIFCKVRVLDLVDIDSRVGFWSAFDAVRGKHVDFVLCEPESFQIVSAIELDDSSHRRSDRVRRDSILEDAFQSAGVNLVRFPVKARYFRQEIADKIADIIVEKRGQKKVEKRS